MVIRDAPTLIAFSCVHYLVKINNQKMWKMILLFNVMVTASD